MIIFEISGASNFPSLWAYEPMGPWACGPKTSGLYYKHITIIIDAASVVSK